MNGFANRVDSGPFSGGRGVWGFWRKANGAKACGRRGMRLRPGEAEEAAPVAGQKSKRHQRRSLLWEIDSQSSKSPLKGEMARSAREVISPSNGVVGN